MMDTSERRGGATMGTSGARLEGLSLGAVSLGWVVAVVSGTVFGGALGLLAGAVGGSAGSLLATVALAIVTPLSGFLAYLVGGYCAARSAGRSGGLNGAMIPVLGLAMGVMPSITFAVFGGLSGAALAVPRVDFGTATSSLLAALVLFLVNLLGGYVGGRLGGRAAASPRPSARSSSASSAG